MNLEYLKALAQASANLGGGSLFKDENADGGYFEKSQFLLDIEKAIKEDKGLFAHCKHAFDYMTARRKVTSETEVIYENGQGVIWIKFGFGNTLRNVKVPAITGMLELVTDYAQKGRSINITFEDLIKRAAGEV